MPFEISDIAAGPAAEPAGGCWKWSKPEFYVKLESYSNT
jgi:hypothetical protein